MHFCGGGLGGVVVMVVVRWGVLLAEVEQLAWTKK